MTSVREQQAKQEIGSILERTFRNQKSVSIQVNDTENGLYEEDNVGVIGGFEDGDVSISQIMAIQKLMSFR